ncbi:MAG TPA: SRPBCC family protein [Candidatus Limnocylindria bacterium]
MATDLDVIERVIDIDASPETVFTLLTDPAEYVKWKGRLAQLEPRRGGLFRVSFKDSAARGEYLEVVPNRRVVFTWGWDSDDPNPALTPPGASLVEIDLEPKESGTLLRLRHSRLPDETSAMHRERWSFYLDRLRASACNRHGRPAA